MWIVRKRPAGLLGLLPYMLFVFANGALHTHSVSAPDRAVVPQAERSTAAHSSAVCQTDSNCDCAACDWLLSCNGCNSYGVSFFAARFCPLIVEREQTALPATAVEHQGRSPPSRSAP